VKYAEIEVNEMARSRSWEEKEDRKTGKKNKKQK
jgi:hypothetical protein